MIFQLLILPLALQVAAEQSPKPSAMLLAQAHDRCLATVASEELGKLEDAEIYTKAKAACGEIERALYEAIRAEYSAQHADLAIRTIEEKSESNFRNVLRRMEAQHNARAAELESLGLPNDGPVSKP